MTHREPNPFEEEEVANEWIRAVEGECGETRDNEIYPLLQRWCPTITGGSLVEIGSGQGICSQHLGNFTGQYFGIEPSTHLVARAKQYYQENSQRKFVVGNAYELPFENESVCGAFSVNVWFHLQNLTRAATELDRVLYPGAPFLIITANPAQYDLWRNFFITSSEAQGMITGKIDIPVNPLSKSDIYLHSLEDLVTSLQSGKLTTTAVNELGLIGSHPNQPLFVAIEGKKSAH